MRCPRCSTSAASTSRAFRRARPSSHHSIRASLSARPSPIHSLMAWPQPPGSSAGPNTFVGRTLGRFNDDLDFRNAQSMRWSLSMQRELPGQWVGRGGVCRQPQLRPDDRFQPQPLPAPVPLDEHRPRHATINFLTANVTNPFRPAPGRNPQRRRAAPAAAAAFPAVPQHRHAPLRRVSSFDSAQFRLDRRFTGGYMADVAYTWSDFKERVTG